jgi:hypothetical protein
MMIREEVLSLILTAHLSFYTNPLRQCYDGIHQIAKLADEPLSTFARVGISLGLENCGRVLLCWYMPDCEFCLDLWRADAKHYTARVLRTWQNCPTEIF